MANRSKMFQKGIVLKPTDGSPSVRGELSLNNSTNKIETVLGSYAIGWDSNFEYFIGTKVKYNNEVYECIRNPNQGQDPAESPLVWQLLTESEYSEVMEIITSDQVQELEFKSIQNCTLDGNVSGDNLDSDINAGSSERIPTSDVVIAYLDSNVGDASFTLDSLNDVNTSTATDGQVFEYQSGTWVNAEAPAQVYPMVSDRDILDNGATTTFFQFNSNLESGVYIYTAERRNTTLELVETGKIYVNNFGTTIQVTVEVLAGDAALDWRTGLYNGTSISADTTNNMSSGGTDPSYDSRMRITQLETTDISVVFNTATSLVVTQQPVDTQLGTTITPSITVEVRDQNNDLITDFTDNITLTRATGTTTVGGATVKTPVGGVATFDDIVLSGDIGPLSFNFAVGSLSIDSNEFFAIIDGPLLTEVSGGWTLVSGSQVTINGTDNRNLTIVGLGSAEAEIELDNTSGYDWAIDFQWRNVSGNQMTVALIDDAQADLTPNSLYYIFGDVTQVTQSSYFAGVGGGVFFLPVQNTNISRTYRLERRSNTLRLYQDGLVIDTQSYVRAYNSKLLVKCNNGDRVDNLLITKIELE